ncbi:MAG: tellurite resistance TerB family protein [Alphaproteobacteria bacterium]|jgi:uncharacterized membrane protein YebE (DUF533 family)|uniref:tellurite resistance TerB family protein n=1 Tax=Bradyrhizobium sp. 2TAF24 TaxID=3233011 RepID=UPI002A2D4827|nr:tellurite resistance TerB family protein [Alphaproteobacteria bacterium]MBL6938168.1 tellurite resistance TerB family protein [Alphaproteobacteria bacterium]MBL7097225.1 tellurite resistance TerB family protein [Alphaproteobacteria bacterium]
MIDVNKLLTTVLSGSPTTGQSGVEGAQPADRGGRAGLGDFFGANVGALGTGALAGGLAGTLLTSKHARKFAGGAMQIGGAALLGGLAYKAYSNYRAGKPLIPQSVSDMLGGLIPGQADAPQEASRGFLSPPDAMPRDGTVTLLLRAMIASAMADGRFDETERARLVERVEASGLSSEERSYLESLIARPDTPDQLAATARGPEAAAQVYLAAFVAIDADTPTERAWLDDLASKLELDPALRRNIEAVGRG